MRFLPLGKACTTSTVYGIVENVLIVVLHTGLTTAMARSSICAPLHYCSMA